MWPIGPQKILEVAIFDTVKNEMIHQRPIITAADSIKFSDFSFRSLYNTHVNVFYHIIQQSQQAKSIRLSSENVTFICHRET